MENVLDELLTGQEIVTEDNGSQEDSDYNHEYDLDIASLAEDDNIEIEEENNQDDAEAEQEVANPTNTAFAQMRTQNKELQNDLNELDALAKAAGLKDYKELIAKGKEAQIKKDAKNKGIPLEVAKELEDMRAFRTQYEQDQENARIKQKESIFASNVKAFADANSLSNDAIKKLSDDLERDGLDVNTLMDMPKTALNRVLSAYTDTKYQKNLERKSAIGKELPITQSSKIDANLLNKDIDDLAKKMAGRL